eukprot:TRINITY_DN348_c1_g1_i1.p1 TRINITY_DN348_c1_g1~~TRINITY_DN348_c1_g1_i1.p1  ORF type:complete len:138 (-),score=53.80 TRINITY_DN348_c1_g1_i1:111-524(-)
MMSKKISVDLEIHPDEEAWLSSMAERHQLPDSDKVLRILLTYARDTAAVKAALQRPAKEEGEAQSGEALRKKKFTVEDFHLKLLEDAAAAAAVSSAEAGSIDKVARNLIQFVRTECDESVIFGVIRCKHEATCSLCK